jgi:hypothetical protein
MNRKLDIVNLRCSCLIRSKDPYIICYLLLYQADDAHDLKRKRLYDLQNAKALTEYRALGLSPTQIRLIFEDLKSLSDVAAFVPDEFRGKLKELSSTVSSQIKTFCDICSSLLLRCVF